MAPTVRSKALLEAAHAWLITHNFQPSAQDNIYDFGGFAAAHGCSLQTAEQIIVKAARQARYNARIASGLPGHHNPASATNGAKNTNRGRNPNHQRVYAGERYTVRERSSEGVVTVRGTATVRIEAANNIRIVCLDLPDAGVLTLEVVRDV